MQVFPELHTSISSFSKFSIPENRLVILAALRNCIQDIITKTGIANLHFICTHNSRRSQFAQVWAHTAAMYFNLPITCYSGGTEVTACNERVISALQRVGFIINSSGNNNPKYAVRFSENEKPIMLYSKLFDDVANPQENFIAVMTCSDADENCPFILGAEKRIKLFYDDPKKFDNTPLEAQKYDERCLQIGAELWFAFQEIHIAA